MSSEFCVEWLGTDDKTWGIVNVINIKYMYIHVYMQGKCAGGRIFFENFGMSDILITRFGKDHCSERGVHYKWEDVRVVWLLDSLVYFNFWEEWFIIFGIC